MRVKKFGMTVVVLAIAATPAVAAKDNALRAVPRPAAVVVKPAAVWIPTPTSGIKWFGGGVRISVRGR